MLDTLLKLVKESDCDGWEITDTTRKGWEFYFIRHQLDQNRVVDTEHVELKVYKKFDEFLGSASTEVPVTASEEEIRKLISLLCEEAVLVKNPVYTLNEPKAIEASDVSFPDIREISKDFLDAFNEIPETATEDINSYEIFVNALTVRFLNSNGIDVTSVYPSSMVEVVVNARKESHEIELYRMYKSGSCDRVALKEAITETLKYGKDRLETTATPNLGKYNVLFSTDAALNIYDYFIDRVSAGFKYRRISDWEPGKPVSEELRNDKVTVRAAEYLQNSSRNQAFDAEGAPVRDLVLIQDGIVKHYWGGRQFAQYLGLDDCFIPGNFTVDGGSKSEAQLREGNFLEVVEFSDFQVDSITGNIAGEIRLGYLHTPEGTAIVSGGSVSGSMLEFVKTMEWSSEQKQYNNYLIPAVTLLKDVSVTGAEF